MPTSPVDGAGLTGTFPQRLRAVGHYARQQTPDEQDALIQKLEAGSPQDQYLAGLAAVATQKKAWIAKHVTDKTSGLQHLALRYSHLVADSVIEDALAGDLSDFTRKALVRHGLSGRPQLADKLFPIIRNAWGDHLAIRVLAHCSPSVVERHLPQLLPSASVTSLWTLLANKHAGILMAALKNSLDDAAESGIMPSTWWDEFGVAVTALLKVDPTLAPSVLDMVDKHKLAAFPHVLNSQLNTFARQDPSRMLEYLSRPNWLSGRSLSRRAMRRIARPATGTPALIKYAETFIGRAWGCDDLLQALRPRDRLPINEAMKIDGTACLDYLPRQDQIRLATSMVEKNKRVPVNRSNELSAVSYLEPSEAAPALEEFMMDPDMETRRHAIQCYVKNAARARSPDVWDAALEKLSTRLRNQPQPVREPVIDTICDVSPLTWTITSLPFIRKIAQDALDAPDMSSVVATLISYALNTMRERPEFEAWCLELLQAINKMDPVYLSEKVRHGQVLKVVQALEPDLKEGLKKKNFNPIYTVANWTGKRLKDIPELQRMLQDITVHIGAESYNVMEALQLLVDVDKSYAVKAVQDERSTLEFESVANVIARYHPELLDLGNPPKGRWLEDATDWTFPCDAYLSKFWPEDQIAIYLEQLKRDVETGDTWNRAMRLRKLKHVPGGISTAKEYTQDKNTRIAEAALSVLASDPKELPTLLSYASTGSARVAMYCAGRAAKHVPTTELQPMLIGVLKGEKTKITSKKEVLRLIARLLPVEVASGILSETASAPNAHRDVITAAAIAALDFLQSSPAGRAIVEETAAKNKETSMAIAKRSPLLVNDRARYAKLVTSLAKAEDDDVASAVLGNLGNWASFDPSAWTILKDAITNMDRRKVWKSAVQALTGRASDPKGQETLCETIAELLAMKEKLEDNAGEDSDLPVFRRVQDIAQRLWSLTRALPSKYGQATRAVLKVIDNSGSRDYEEEYCDLLLSLWKLDHRVLDTAIARLDDRPILAQRFAETMRNWLQPSEALPVATKLASGGYTGALFAVALAGRMGPKCCWEKEWKDVVKTLRGHDSPEIRDLARHIKAVQQDTM